MKKKCGKNYFKGPKMAAKDDATILFAATILTAPTVCVIERESLLCPPTDTI